MSNRLKTKSSSIVQQAGAQFYDRFVEGIKGLKDKENKEKPPRHSCAPAALG